MKNYWKQFVEWVIALRFRPFRNAQAKLTIIYVLNVTVIFGVFILVLNYFRVQYIKVELGNAFLQDVATLSIVQDIYDHLQVATLTLVSLVLMAMAILSYFFISITLRPLKSFVNRQRRFISDASHELRTPLATVKTENEIALLDPDSVSREEAISLLRSNIEEVDRIATILNNLLNLASFESANGAPPFTAVNFSAIARRVLDRMKMLAEHRNVRLTAPDLPSILVWGNVSALEEVVSNLVKNAIQYTPADGEVSLNIEVRSKHKKADLVVRDTGIGIAQEDLPYIFEPFYRSDKSTDMHTQGNGLGLPLVREIVKRHRGFIDIQSTRGKGTSVTVSIPLAPKT